MVKVISILVACTTALGCAESTIVDSRAIAFRDDCASSLNDYAKTQRTVLASGWKSVESDKHPELEAVMSFAQKLDPNLIAKSEFQSYVKDLDGIAIYLVLAHVPFEEKFLNGCYVYGFDDSKIDRSSVISVWLGADPTETVNHPGLIQQNKWIGPTKFPHLATVRVGAIPDGSSVADETGFSGAIWAATSVSN